MALWWLSVLALMAFVLGWGTPTPTPSDPVWLTEARFRWVDASLEPFTPALADRPVHATDHPPVFTGVTLPHTWPRLGPQAMRGGLYELDFHWLPDLSHDPEPALHIARISGHHRIWLNGRLLQASTPGNLTLPTELMVQIPPTMLLPGPNRLDIEVRHAENGGLTPPLFGEMRDVSLVHARRVFLTQTLPILINVVAATAALSLILIWWRRPQEAGMGLLGLLSLIVSVRNCAYHVQGFTPLPPALSSWLFFNAQVATSVVLGLFALQMSDRPRQGYRRMLWITLCLLPPAAALCAWAGLLTPLRSITYPVLMIEALIGLVLLLRSPQRNHPAHWGVLVGLALAMAAAVHDHLLLQGQLAITGVQWLPMTTPVALLAYVRILFDRFVQAMSDVETHNAELEQRVHARTQDLARAHAEKSRLMAAASHDLRQPVAAMGMISSLLHHQLRDSPMHQLTGHLGEAVAALESLVDGLLEVSNLDAGQIQPQRSPCDLHALIARVCASELPSARLKGLRLRWRAPPVWVNTDPKLLSSMLRNLIGNAVRYTERGGVLVGVRTRGRHVRIEVWDTGHGIAPDDQQRIFQDFIQLPKPSPPRAGEAMGLGLGLAIVQRTSVLLDHPVTLRSQPGRGSCFAIELPLAADIAPADRVAA